MSVLLAFSHLCSSVNSSVDFTLDAKSSNLGYAKSAIRDKIFYKYADINQTPQSCNSVSNSNYYYFLSG